MPVQYTIPPDTRSVGSSGLVSDHNNTVDVIAAMGSALNVLNAAYAGGADPTGVLDSTAAFQAAINAAPGASNGYVIVPPGTYRCDTAQLVLVSGLKLIAPGGFVNTTINCTAGGAYLFNLDPPGFSTTVHLEDVVISGFHINATGMDIFWGANIVRSRIINNFLQQNSTAFSIMNVRQSTGTNGVTYLSMCEFANKEFVGGTPRTTEAWHLDFSGTGLRCNDNVWHGGGNMIWSSLNGDTAMYWMKVIGEASAATGSRHNVLRDLIFELDQGTGGLVHLQNTTNWLIENLSLQDLASNTIGNPILQCSTNGSPGGCQAIVIRNYWRRGGANISNTNCDIKLDANASQITIDSPAQTSGGAVLNVNLNSATNIALTGAWPPNYIIQNELGAFTNGTDGSDNDPQPEDAGYAGWTYDPAPMNMNNGQALTTAGVVYLVKIPVRLARNITTIRSLIVTAGVTLTSGQCFAGIYSSAGTRQGLTANQSVAWVSTGDIDMALTAGIMISPPFVWVALLFNGTTGPAFLRQSGTATANITNGNLGVAIARAGSILTGQTTLPASITPASIAKINHAWFMGVF